MNSSSKRSVFRPIIDRGVSQKRVGESFFNSASPLPHFHLFDYIYAWHWAFIEAWKKKRRVYSAQKRQSLLKTGRKLTSRSWTALLISVVQNVERGGKKCVLVVSAFIFESSHDIAEESKDSDSRGKRSGKNLHHTVGISNASNSGALCLLLSVLHCQNSSSLSLSDVKCRQHATDTFSPLLGSKASHQSIS